MGVILTLHQAAHATLQALAAVTETDLAGFHAVANALMEVSR